MEKYEEIRIEITADELLNILRVIYREPLTGYKHNNTFIGGYKDIGLDGWIIFVLRKQEARKDEDDKAKDRGTESQP